MWELDHKEGWTLKNWCIWTVVLEKTLEGSLECKEMKPVHPKSVLNIHWKYWCWSWNSNTLAIWCKELTHWKRPWCCKRLKRREADGRGWDGWMASQTQWTRVWAISRKIMKPGVLQSTGLQSYMTEQLKNHKVLNLRITSLYFLGFNNLSGNFNFRNYFDWAT